MKRMLVANWKMNGDVQRVRAFAFAMNQLLARQDTASDIVFCPPALYLADAKQMLPLNAQLALGAQNCHAAVKGAFTGEISATMLMEIGCRYVILGHSERRAMGETDVMVMEKAEAAIAAGLKPILCVGESRAEYEAGNTVEVLSRQLGALHSLKAGSFVIAYEPIWAIGTGLTPKIAEISAAHAAIKSVLGSGTDVLYGGSVNAGNLREILALPEVAGALIGGASLEIESMIAMLAIAAA